MSVKPKVIIRQCETYDAERIRVIVREAMEELDLRPKGRTLVKPNIVIADKKYPHAFTRPEVCDGVLAALRDRDEGEMSELAVGERCGITVPTRMVFRNAGYHPVVKKHRAKTYFFDEERQVEIKLTHPDRLRDYVYTPEPVARADFFVNMPKFKAHPWTTMTLSMKNYIGIQDDRHRLIDHDHRLNDKICDLQEIVQPQLIVIDGVIAGQERMLTPTPFDLKLIIIGNNQPAFDSVCCNIIGLDPRTVDHIRMGHERGYGPLDLSEIEITGDITLEEAQVRAKGFRTGLIRVEDYFKGTKITAYAGPPPEQEYTDYCWGGCPGAIEEAIEIIRQTDARADEKMKPFSVVFGAYKGPIDAAPGDDRFAGRIFSLDSPAGDQWASEATQVRGRVLTMERSSQVGHATVDPVTGGGQFIRVSDLWPTPGGGADSFHDVVVRDEAQRVLGRGSIVADQWRLFTGWPEARRHLTKIGPADLTDADGDGRVTVTMIAARPVRKPTAAGAAPLVIDAGAKMLQLEVTGVREDGYGVFVATPADAFLNGQGQADPFEPYRGQIIRNEAGTRQWRIGLAGEALRLVMSQGEVAAADLPDADQDGRRRVSLHACAPGDVLQTPASIHLERLEQDSQSSARPLQFELLANTACTLTFPGAGAGAGSAAFISHDNGQTWRQLPAESIDGTLRIEIAEQHVGSGHALLKLQP